MGYWVVLIFAPILLSVSGLIVYWAIIEGAVRFVVLLRRALP